jgi:hypothetical protein
MSFNSEGLNDFVSTLPFVQALRAAVMTVAPTIAFNPFFIHAPRFLDGWSFLKPIVVRNEAENTEIIVVFILIRGNRLDNFHGAGDVQNRPEAKSCNTWRVYGIYLFWAD